MKHSPLKKRSAAKTNYPVALILAGYNRPDRRTKRKLKKEIRKAYDGDEIYIGENKFLYPLAGKPVIQHVLDAVYAARKNGKRLYREIYIYNDRESFLSQIDLSLYPGVTLLQMTDSVAGHWLDFYPRISYGQRVDVFFGDTPRIAPDDVVYIHEGYGRILGKKNIRSVPIAMAFGIAEYEDMKDDSWLTQRLRPVRGGPNRGKHRNFVGFDSFEARIGNCAACIKTKSMDPVIAHRVLDFGYNLRKALAPRTFSRIIYYLWKTGHLGIIKQLKHRALSEQGSLSMISDVVSRLYDFDANRFGIAYFHIKRNASRWENDIDGPNDYAVFRRRMG